VVGSALLSHCCALDVLVLWLWLWWLGFRTLAGLDWQQQAVQQLWGLWC
jgi:hypothetical protein